MKFDVLHYPAAGANYLVQLFTLFLRLNLSVAESAEVGVRLAFPRLREKSRTNYH
jgi:hypothetical protein